LQHAVSNPKNKTFLQIVIYRKQVKSAPSIITEVVNHFSSAQSHVQSSTLMLPFSTKTCLRCIISLIFASSLHFVGCNERNNEHSIYDLTLNKNSAVLSSIEGILNNKHIWFIITLMHLTDMSVIGYNAQCCKNK